MRTRRGRAGLSIAIGLLLLPVASLAQEDSPGVAVIASQRIISGLNVPSYVVAPPGDTTRLFITELNTGLVHIYKDGALLPAPFLRVPSVSTGNERGLLSLAFHPDYAVNGYFYVFYTSSLTGGSVVARYSVSTDPDVADSTSAAEIIAFPPPQSNHIGGWLGFGPDGYLYISKGDGLNMAGVSQDLGSPLGKMLRVDVNGGFPYTIPPSNPYAAQSYPTNLIWSLGFRNPWRCSFDRVTGDFYMGEVGNFAVEEIDYQPSTSSGGENYGWPMFEGDQVFDCPDPCDSSGLTAPLIPLPHSPDPPFFCAVTGGYVYRGSAIPGLQGTYFYGDFCSGQIWSLRVVDGQPAEITNRVPELDPAGSQGVDLVISFGEDASGEIYFCDYGGGEVFKIVPNATGVPDAGSSAAGAISLSMPVPNPSRAGVRFQVGLSTQSELRVSVFDTSGRQIRNLLDQTLAGGTHSLAWDARDDRGGFVPAGIYLVRVQSNGVARTGKITIAR